MAQLASLSVNDTGSLTLPSGTIDNRPSLSSTVIVQWTNTGTQAVSVTSGSATTTTTSWTCPTGVTSIEVLVVAGGGAGGGYHGGGGGAGGVIYNSAFPVTPATTYTVTVGQGGSAATQTSNTGNPGSNSVFATLTAIGGGAGLSQGNTPASRNNGGSGGGASDYGSGFTTGGSGTPGQGHQGGGFIGSGDTTPISYSTCGGGGAGGPGGSADSTSGGFGGPGVNYNISGTPTWYGGGGGGTQLATGLFSATTATYGLGGVGGGGVGGYTATSGGAAVRSSASGVNGTGGGGGGYLYSGLGGGAGGSGIVIIRYALATATTQPTGQTRFNTVNNTFENYETSNKWKTAPIGDNIVTDGLVAYLDGARYSSGTTWVDMSGYGNNVTLTNGPTYTSTNGGALVFDGSNDYAVSGTFTQHQTTTITLSAWVYPTQISTNAYAISMGGDPNGTARGIRIENGVWSAIGYGSGGTHDFNSTNAPGIVNAWQHVCAVWNGTSVTFYLNGQVTASTTCSGLITPNGSAFYIGSLSWSAGSAVWTGRIANASIYTKALTPEEVKQNYNAQSYRFELASPVEDRQSYVTDRLVVDLDISNPACSPAVNPQASISTSKLLDLASGSIGTLGNGALPVATPNYKFVRLDGTNDYIGMSSPNIYLGNQHSYDFWIYVTGIKDATYARAYILDLRGDGADSGCSSYFLWDYASAGVVNFTTGNSGIEVNINGVALSTNAWHHMATTRDGNQWRIYLDGALVGQGTSNLTGITLNNGYRIGMYSAWGFGNAQYALPGYVGAARIYAKTLTSGEVMTNYQAMKNRFGL
jgi:hypothetical protein